jgi:hypothetical protein
VPDVVNAVEAQSQYALQAESNQEALDAIAVFLNG